MSDPLAIGGEFADLKTVKSRSTVQMIIELPIEEGERIVRMFGFPQPSNPVKVAIARLASPTQIEATAEPANGRQHGPWHTLDATLQSVLRCKQEAFWRFLREVGDDPRVTDEASAATHIRTLCRVNSRSSLTGTAETKWREIDSRYIAWLQGVDA